MLSSTTLESEAFFEGCKWRQSGRGQSHSDSSTSPVELRTAVRADHISFRLLHKQDLSPVKYERVCLAEDEPVPWNEIVKGYE
ncbi:MAG TPA: Ku protein [Thermoanaerobaculia bacterium]|nr:Ku protein [Thermoanaerobaculia bacterium]